jgi:glycosyltransferase involved in cell wall biosynthesis
MVKNALRSVLTQSHEDWEVACVDDGSDVSLESVVKKVVPEELQHKFTHYNTHDTIEKKLEQGGSMAGKHLNEAILASDSEIIIILCDDDALYPEYLKNLSKYFTDNPEVKYAYSHVVVYDPLTQKPEPTLIKKEWFLNRTGPIDPYCNIDASQGAWRATCTKEAGISLPFPQTCNLDATLYRGLYNKYGPCNFTGFNGQYKGVHEDQLGKRDGAHFYKPKDINE